MYHFSGDNKIRHRSAGTYFSVLLFIVLFAAFIYLLNGVSDDTLDRQESSLNSALNRAIVSCYSIEGTYPPDLDYIVSHYGLIYDKDTFFVDYRAIGSNIYPDVTVIRKDGE